MGWRNCGKDSKGRNIGYAFPAKCDHKGCKEKIHRGLAYACGGMHGEEDFSCEKYFCGKHRNNHIKDDDGWLQVCEDCYKFAVENGWDEEKEEWRE